LIFAFVRSLIGSFGRAIMDFYISNSLLINSLVLLYGLLVFISRRNYYFIINAILVDIGLVDTDKRKLTKSKLTNAKFEKINWDVVRKKVKFPFFTAPKKWTIHPGTKKKIMDAFDLETLNGYISEIKTNQE